MAFCTNCGKQVDEGLAFCPSCGTAMGQNTAPQPQQQINNQAPQQPIYNQAPQQPIYNQAPQQQMYNQAPQQQMGYQANKSSKETLGLLLGIFGIIGAVLGSILFGLFLSIPSMAAGVIAMVLSVDIKKSSNNQRGSSVMVVGVIAIIFGLIFTIGCAAFGGSLTGGYGCYGVVGGSCKAANDVANFYSLW